MCRATTTTTRRHSLKQLTGDQRYYRYYQTQLYVQDTWKVMPSLTLTYGVDLSSTSVCRMRRAVLRASSLLTFDQYMQARVKQSSASPVGHRRRASDRLRPGRKGQWRQCPRLYQPEYMNFSPHLGFAWNPSFDKKTVFNGSAGIVYDRTVVSCDSASSGRVFLSLPADQVDFRGNSQRTRTIRSRPIRGWPRVTAHCLLPSRRPQRRSLRTQPFSGDYCTSGGYPQSPCGLLNGLAFNETIDPYIEDAVLLHLQRRIPASASLQTW